MNQTRLANKKVALVTLGCKVNQYESDAIARLLCEAGCVLTEACDMADIYIVNTCSVTNMADRKSRQMLHRAKKKNPDALIVAVGCLVQAKPEQVCLDDAVDIVIGTNKKKDIVTILTKYYDTETKQKQAALSKDIMKETDYEEFCAGVSREKTRAYVKVQDGCNQFCSYCIIPYTRGRIRSRSISDTITEVEALAKEGYQEIILTGIHLSSYGMEQQNHMPALGDLIKEVSKVEPIKRIRLGSLEPRMMTEEFIEDLGQNEKICPHFHLSLQSACNETLVRMNRKYTIEQYMKTCERIRSHFSNPAITTDVIVGFPGETDEEFQITIDNLERLKLYEMHVFKFSPRSGTKAEHMEGQVPWQIKTKRSDILLDMTKRQKNAYEASFIGHKLEVLTEEPVMVDGITYMSGHTKNYIKTMYPLDEAHFPKDASNRLVNVFYDKPYSRLVKKYKTYD